MWAIASYQPVQDRLFRSLAWTTPLCKVFPKSIAQPAWPWISDLSNWSGGGAHRFEYYLIEEATWGTTIAPVDSDEFWHYPVWPAIAIYHILVVWGVRELFERRGLRRRTDLPRGHLFWARWPEFRTCVLSALLCMPLFAVWRLERSVWEASFMTTPAGAGAWQSIEMFRGALLAMLVQIALVHWVVTWHIHRRSLEGDDAPVESRAQSPDGRCPWCGYQSDSHRCPECGADRNDAKSIRPRIRIPWIEQRAWLRWVFRTPTALGAIAFLFFAPVWVPAIRLGIEMIVP